MGESPAMNGYGWFPGLMSGGDGESGEFGRRQMVLSSSEYKQKKNTMQPSHLKVIMATSKSITPAQPFSSL